MSKKQIRIFVTRQRSGYLARSQGKAVSSSVGPVDAAKKCAMKLLDTPCGIVLREIHEPDDWRYVYSLEVHHGKRKGGPTRCMLIIDELTVPEASA